MLKIKYYHKSFHYTLFCALYTFILCAVTPAFSNVSTARSPEKLKQEQNKKESKGKAFRVQFFSLKKEHSMGPAAILLYDRGILEIKMERETLITPPGKYTITDYLFEADWEFTMQKAGTYRYSSHFKGLYLFDTYIIGLFTLSEYIEEGRLTQQIPFIFFAAVSDK